VTPQPAPPVERVRRRLSGSLGPAVADSLPGGFQRLGGVVVVRLPESLRPHFPEIGAAYLHEFRARAVLRRRGGSVGEFRLPEVEPIAGHGTETVVVEHGVRYHFDAARVMFAAGNHSERARAGRLVRPGETVVDLFAGIGYFALPAAVHGQAARVHACEANPVAFRYLEENAARNGVSERLSAHRGDNREAPIAAGSGDRVFLGLLPESLPWVPRALDLLAPGGGWLHVHRLTGTRDAPDAPAGPVLDLVGRAGREVVAASVHVVKPYGPGRDHVVVDVEVGPVRPAPRRAPAP
jgi:tRNA wybutosine-synthesizing protein 2